MATILYRPEQENPTRDGGLSVTYTGKNGVPLQILDFEPGLNRKVNDYGWEAVKETPSVKALIKIGAIEELTPAKEKELIEAAKTAAEKDDLSDVLGLGTLDASRVIEASFDEAFLDAWKLKEGRTGVINKINQRIRLIKEGKA